MGFDRIVQGGQVLTPAMRNGIEDAFKAPVHDFYAAYELGTIAWLPWLKDHTCFRKFVDEPRYESAISAIEARLAGIRERLPETLAKQGLLPTLPDQK